MMRCQRCGGPYHHEEVSRDRDELREALRAVVEALDADWCVETATLSTLTTVVDAVTSARAILARIGSSGPTT